MEQKQSINHKIAGLIIAGAVIVLSIAGTLISGGAGNTTSGWLTYLIIIAGLIVFINLYGKSKDNFVTFGDLFSYGFKATAVYTVIFVVFLVLFNLLFPEFKEKALEAARVQMENQDRLSDEQIDQALEMTQKYFWVFAIGGTAIGFVIIGAIGSLIGAAVTKKRPVNPLDQLSE
ncbi:MAG: DUF4199 domain-containing protein [Chitinophagaceae bacterium]